MAILNFSGIYFLHQALACESTHGIGAVVTRGEDSPGGVGTRESTMFFRTDGIRLRERLDASNLRETLTRWNVKTKL